MARFLKFQIKEVEELYYLCSKKAMISIAVTVQLICAFIFAYMQKADLAKMRGKSKDNHAHLQYDH